MSQRNKQSRDQCPPDLLMTDDGELLCMWLCVFVTELRKSDGSEYTPRSIAQLLGGSQCHINAEKKEPSKIVDGRSPIFKDLHAVLDRRYRELHAQGLKESVQLNGSLKFVLVLKKNSCGILKHLVWTHHWHFSMLCFSIMVLNFVLRGGQEHSIGN